MAQIALPRQSVTQAPQPAAVGSPLYQRRRTSNVGPVEMIQNPAFSFPQQYADESAGPTLPHRARPMSLQSYPSGRRGSAPGPRQKSVSALPAFSFNPAAPAMPSDSNTSPPHSPTDSTLPVARPMGHRRGGSEFIGGSTRAGDIPLLSTSPSKDNGFLPPPSGPPASRARHAHRRSGAISQHDLSMIMRGPEPPTQVGSAPATPQDGNQCAFGHSVNKSVSQPCLRDLGLSEDVDNSPERPPSRPRVGFSEKIEYIRPLSTISSETETSLSTIRNHSTTNSLSSIISIGSSTPPRLSRPPVIITSENEGRPSTAGAILDVSPRKNTHFGGDMFSRKRPMSAVSPVSPASVPSSSSSREPAKRRSFFRLEPRRSEIMVPRLQTSVSDPALSVSLPDPVPSPQEEDDQISGCGKSKPAARKSGGRPRKVKSWANSIISRKGRHGGKPKYRAPTPPLAGPADLEDSSGSEDWDFDDANFDVDNTVTIVSEPQTNSQARTNVDIASWQPRPLARVDSDTKINIDLDAALGPFNSPQRGFGDHRRSLHSAKGLSRDHRRTESAPELVPFERPSAMGSSSPMENVFEEDEPEDDTIIAKESPSPAERHVKEVEDLRVQVVEAESSHNGPAINWNFDDGLCIKHGSKAREEPVPLSPLQVPVCAVVPVSRRSMEVSPVEVVEDYEEPRTSSLTHSSDSTVTPQLSAVDPKEHQPVMSLPLPLPQQSLMTPDTFTSSFSSPDFQCSEASFDTPRLGTSTSSMTDYQALPSPHFGEPGPEMRASTDVPSLSSSRSTMTSAMQNAFPTLNSRHPSERSTSLCSVPSELENRRKRSSIASLSRLINGSSFAEKSKLSIEQRPQSEYLEPNREVKKKHRRLSKLMFWKPKEGTQT